MKHEIQLYYYVSKDQIVTYFISCRSLDSLSRTYYKLSTTDYTLEKVHNIVDIIIDEQNLKKLLPSNPQFALFRKYFGLCKNNHLYDKKESQAIVDNLTVSL